VTLVARDQLDAPESCTAIQPQASGRKRIISLMFQAKSDLRISEWGVPAELVGEYHAGHGDERGDVERHGAITVQCSTGKPAPAGDVIVDLRLRRGGARIVLCQVADDELPGRRIATDGAE
jgi:hypothetical protein